MLHNILNIYESTFVCRGNITKTTAITTKHELHTFQYIKVQKRSNFTSNHQ